MLITFVICLYDLSVASLITIIFFLLNKDPEYIELYKTSSLHERLNILRNEWGLESIGMPEQNFYLDEDILINSTKKLFPT